MATVQQNNLNNGGPLSSKLSFLCCLNPVKLWRVGNSEGEDVKVVNDEGVVMVRLGNSAVQLEGDGAGPVSIELGEVRNWVKLVMVPAQPATLKAHWLSPHQHIVVFSSLIQQLLWRKVENSSGSEQDRVLFWTSYS